MQLITAGYAPIFLKRGMDKAYLYIEDSIYNQTYPVRTQDEVEGVATISANGDRKIGKIIAEAVAKVGKDGIVSIEEGRRWTLPSKPPMVCRLSGVGLALPS
jgi:chaperonin GroEL